MGAVGQARDNGPALVGIGANGDIERHLAEKGNAKPLCFPCAPACENTSVRPPQCGQRK